MIPVSLICVVHNEEKYLKESFDLLAPYVDEFVVIDQESTDSTVNIARQYTDKVYLFPRVYYQGAYIPHVALMAKNDWVLKCDPDERWDEIILKNIQSYLTGEYDIIRFRMIYKNNREGSIFSFGARIWKRNKVLWTDSFDPIPYNQNKLKQLYVEEGFINNLNSPTSALDRYRREGARRLLARYGDTRVEPYANYCKYYSEIVEGKQV